MMRIVLVMVCAVATSACVRSASGIYTTYRYPTRSELLATVHARDSALALAHHDAPVESQGHDAAEASHGPPSDRFTMSALGSLVPTDAEEYEPPAPWRQRPFPRFTGVGSIGSAGDVGEQDDGWAVRNAGATDCVLIQLGEYVRRNAVLPQGALMDFLGAYCGLESVIDNVAFVRRAGDPTAERHRLSSLLRREGYSQAVNEVGSATDGVMIGLRYRPRLWLEDPPHIVAETSFELAGRLRDPTDRIRAYVNVGAHSAQRCSVDADETGEFLIRCPFAAEDSFARVEVVTSQPDRFWGRTAARWMVVRPGVVPVYRRRTLPPGFQPSADLASNAAVLIAEFRAEQALPPLQFDVAQSTDLQEVLATIDLRSATEETLDLLGTYTEVGWKIALPLLDSTTAYDTLFGPARDCDWLLRYFDDPSFRYHILDADFERVAIASVPRPDGSTDVLIGAYAPYDPEMATEHAYAVLDRVNALRADRSLPRALRITGVDDVRLILEAHVAGRITFAKARHRILEWLANTTHRRTWSWVGVYVPDAPLPVLDEMVGSGRNEFVVELVYVRPTTAALGHYLICIAWFD